MRYRIFNQVLESNIPLPELKHSTAEEAYISFSSIPNSSSVPPDITWKHHWRLPNGQISISSGKRKEDYWLHFPQLAHFKLSPSSNKVSCYHSPEIPANSIRHLLLDQVIPRLLSHNGKQILHASSVKINHSAILFSGQSGWGKSTLAGFFHTQGYPLLTDDCVMLERTGAEVMGYPNYCGARLFQDSLSFLPGISETSSIDSVSHYCTKKRLIMAGSMEESPSPIQAVFILKAPEQSCQLNHPVTIRRLYGAAAAMALVENGFPLDITDTGRMGKQLQNLAHIGNADTFTIYSLQYPRQADILPDMMANVLEILHIKPIKER